MTRDKATVIAELKVVLHELTEKAAAIQDCGGFQGLAVLSNNPELREKLCKLSEEAESLGINAADLK